MERTIALFSCLYLFLSTSLGAQDKSEYNEYWPQWRGPLATGVAPHANPPIEWGENQNIRWKVRIPGKGNASPIVWGNKVFILTAIEIEKAVLLVLKKGLRTRDIFSFGNTLLSTNEMGNEVLMAMKL